ncbi:hypothetical protein KZX46_03050 (plasmid) [Polymorphobacter sp. PAMC 29334]|uniref:hypothetical protein n=1 Tax=Polymorphobacter sp. PAMC 29334 TaxID=2862331 RepID=UPI001C775565|nr:hypothetical protein [Polymorphobacter sp. PAMC 29334]QYE33116.1 hypothetical protein KZX46_03050 [Polymorphobacter sp. PAMC 29334]
MRPKVNDVSCIASTRATVSYTLTLLFILALDAVLITVKSLAVAGSRRLSALQSIVMVLSGAAINLFRLSDEGEREAADAK